MKEHEILFTSPPDREREVAEIFYNHVQWVEINNETGIFQVEFYAPQKTDVWKFDYHAVVNLLNGARTTLESGNQRSHADGDPVPAPNVTIEETTHTTGDPLVRISINNHIWADLFNIHDNSCTIELHGCPTAIAWVMELDCALHALDKGFFALQAMTGGKTRDQRT